jgi:hypothetical protein
MNRFKSALIAGLIGLACTGEGEAINAEGCSGDPGVSTIAQESFPETTAVTTNHVEQGVFSAQIGVHLAVTHGILALLSVVSTSLQVQPETTDALPACSEEDFPPPEVLSSIDSCIPPAGDGDYE